MIAIAERGLANNQTCEAIVLPDTVRVISKSAFTLDVNLKFIHLGSFLERIGDNAFNGCNSLEFVKPPDGMQEIGINVFANAKVIKYIEIPASVTEITDVFYFKASNNPDVEIRKPKGSKAEEAANSLGLKVVND